MVDGAEGDGERDRDGDREPSARSGLVGRGMTDFGGEGEGETAPVALNQLVRLIGTGSPVALSANGRGRVDEADGWSSSEFESESPGPS